MEGIPPDDIKEHERQKQGGRPGSPSSGEDEPAPKKVKPEGLLGNGPGPLPGGPGGMMPGMMQQHSQGPMPPHHMPHPHMGQFGPPMGHPMMGHMGHHHMGPHFMGPGMPMMGHMGSMGPPPMNMPVNQGNNPPQNKPLFPSAATPATTANSTPVGADFKPISTSNTPIGPVKPTFPAYSTANTQGNQTTTPSPSSGESPQKVVLINTTGASSKIIHPQEDISLEEFRSKLPKYQRPPPVKTVDSSTSTPQPQVEFVVFQEDRRTIMPRFQPRPPMSVSAVPVSVPTIAPPVNSVAIMSSMAGPPIMRHAMPMGPPTMLGGNMNMMRPPPMGLPPGLIGALPPGAMHHYAAGPPMAFPGPPMLTPMMHPRFR